MDTVKKCENDVRFTFEQLKGIIYKQAVKMSNKFNGKYEVDELVNEVWATGTIQKLKTIKFASSRAYYDMIDYIRRMEGRHILRKGVFFPSPKEKTNAHNFISSAFDFFANQPSRERNPIDYVGDKDQVKYILSTLPKRHLNIIKKYFLDEIPLKDIAKELGIKICTASNTKNRILRNIVNDKYINKRLKKVRKTKKVDKAKKVINKTNNISMETILPEFVVDFEIDNKCSVAELLVLEID